MRNFQQKRNNRKWANLLQSKPVLALLSIGVFLFAWGVVSFLSKMDETSQNREIAERKTTELLEQKQDLTAKIAKLNTESGVEESIRDKFGLVKDGEQVIVVVDDKNPPKAEDSSSHGFFGFFKNLFK